MSKLITVFGATGKQGSSVVKACHANGFKVRALTRNPASDKAKSLVEKGYEVVKVDLDSAESIRKAIVGAYFVFGVTNSIGLEMENVQTAHNREIAQGKAIGDACKKEGVKHLVFSGSEHVKEIIGKSCIHFDAKAIVEKYLDKIQVPNTSVRIAFYFENFLDICPPEKGKDGIYTMTYPLNGPMGTISVGDLGMAVVTIFNNPNEYIGQKIGLCGDRMTMGEYAAVISETTGTIVKYNQLTLEAFANLPFPGARDFAAMYEFFEVGNVVQDIELTRKLNPDTATFKQWADKNKDKLVQLVE